MFFSEICVISRTPTWSNTYEQLQNKLQILKDHLIQFIKEVVYGKTSIQKEMFGENMFCGKCPFGVIGAKYESLWKVLGI